MKVEKELSPVLISVYNRYNHFVRCIESLKDCYGAKNTSLFITTDGPFTKEDKVEINKIRKYIDKITGFKRVIVFAPEQNTRAQVLREAYKEIKNQYSSMIRCEDDIIFTYDFLNFMNDALVKYENEEKVYSVSAFSHSIFFNIENEKKEKVYFTKRHNPWGSGIWFKKREIAKNINQIDLGHFLQDKSNIIKLDEIGIDLYPELSKINRDNLEIPGDYKSIIAMLIHDMYTVSPYSSKAFNIGNDGSGSRTRKSKRFGTIDLDHSFTAHAYHLVDFNEEYINNSFNKRFFRTNRARAKRILTSIGLYDMVYPIKKIFK